MEMTSTNRNLAPLWGSPVSVVVTNLYTEDFETMAITTFDDGFKFWVHYVDDIFCIVKKTV